MKSLKINAVTTLIKSLGFNREGKEELLKILQKDLVYSSTPRQEEKKPQTAPSSSPPPEKHGESSKQEYGEKQKFEMLFEDGTTSFYRRRNQKPIAIVLNGRERKFGLYCRLHNCQDGRSHDTAKKYAQTLPQIAGYGHWRVLCTADCYVMRDCFHSLNRQLQTLGFRTIVESRTYGVLASDDKMTGATNWQIWFAIDL